MARRIFVSSVQGEFAEERRTLRDYVAGDALLSRHFEAFLFEDQPAQSRSPTKLYLHELDDSAVYVGLFGFQYGHEDAEGVSPTEREFNRAVEKRKHRLVFIRQGENVDRHPKMLKLIARAESQLTRRKFVGIPDLTAQLYASLIRILELERVLSSLPFDAALSTLKLSAIDADLVHEFTQRAEAKRNFRLKGPRDTKSTLVQLNLFEGNTPKNAAILLFGEAPERSVFGAETKCLHYPGSVPLRPALSQQTLRGTVFEQTDAAIEFVMSRLAVSVGTRTKGAAVPTTFEIPRAAVAEAVVNAVAHRDYTSNAGVQVSVFSDRVEVANPGELPRGLTPDQLRVTHSSIPRNPLIAEGLFLAGYIDKAGTGTLDMIAQCRGAGLPEPDFEQRGDQWTVVLWRDWLTDALLQFAALSQRQMTAIAHIKGHGRIDNRTYQEITGASERTASRDLAALAKLGFVERIGETGRGASYQRAKTKPAVNPPNPPIPPEPETRHKPAKPANPKRTGKPRAPRKRAPKRR